MLVEAHLTDCVNMLVLRVNIQEKNVVLLGMGAKRGTPHKLGGTQGYIFKVVTKYIATVGTPHRLGQHTKTEG